MGPIRIVTVPFRAVAAADIDEAGGDGPGGAGRRGFAGRGDIVPRTGAVAAHGADR